MPNDNNGGRPAGSPVSAGPVPTTIGVGHAIGPSGGFVLVTLTTPLGPATYWLAPDSIDAICDGLRKAAGMARSGLHSARPGEVAPLGDLPPARFSTLRRSGQG